MQEMNNNTRETSTSTTQFSLATQAQNDTQQEATIIEKIKQRIYLFKVNGRATLPGLSTGYTELDNIIGGFQEGHLITLAARTGHGKSWIALNFLINIALEQNISSLLISLEMSHDQNMYRLLSLLTGISSKKMKDGDIAEDELIQLEEAHKTITKSLLIIEEDTTLSNLKNLSDRIEKANRDGVKFIIIDHVGLIHESERYSDNRVIEMGKISRKIKMLAKKLKIRILRAALNGELQRDEPEDAEERSKYTIWGTYRNDIDTFLCAKNDTFFLEMAPRRSGGAQRKKQRASVCASKSFQPISVFTISRERAQEWLDYIEKLIKIMYKNYE